MRLIVLLLALLIVGLLVHRQLAVAPAPSVELPGDGAAAEVPRVPQRPQDLPAFEQQLQQFMHDSAEERRRQLEPLER